MPTYEYRCQKCGHQFDIFQSMKDERLTDCPLEQCDGKVKRLLGTGAGFIFKGAGFYETDYRSESYKKAATAESKSSGASGDSGGASSADASTSPKKDSAAAGSGSGDAASKGESGAKSPTP